MTIAIVGASGFLGVQLINRLLHTSEHDIVAIARLPHDYHVAKMYQLRLKVKTATIMDESEMFDALLGVDVAFYFVHLMGQTSDFYAQEAIAAERFSSACRTANVKRVIYMGGLGNDHENLSEHLLSRHNTGTILRDSLPLVLEFRASMIIGNGSLAYDVIRNLVHKLPIMTLPRWSNSRTQPIALDDALNYLVAGISVRLRHNEIVEIGGSDVVTYKELYRRYAAWSGRYPFIIRLPFLPEWLGGWWLNLFMPRNHAKIGRIMVRSLSNSMVVTHPEITKRLFPEIHPASIETALNATRQA